jgi:UDP-2-acetamido-2-deoxy-ribo-hexuluronate aminotransferase
MMKRLGAKIAMIVNHGSSKRYYHDEIGVNSRLDTLQAVVLDTKLPHLDEYNQGPPTGSGLLQRAFEEVFPG